MSKDYNRKDVLNTIKYVKLPDSLGIDDEDNHKSASKLEIKSEINIQPANMSSIIDIDIEPGAPSVDIIDIPGESHRPIEVELLPIEPSIPKKSWRDYDRPIYNKEEKNELDMKKPRVIPSFVKEKIKKVKEPKEIKSKPIKSKLKEKEIILDSESIENNEVNSSLNKDIESEQEFSSNSDYDDGKYANAFNAENLEHKDIVEVMPVPEEPVVKSKKASDLFPFKNVKMLNLKFIESPSIIEKIESKINLKPNNQVVADLFSSEDEDDDIKFKSEIQQKKIKLNLGNSILQTDAIKIQDANLIKVKSPIRNSKDAVISSLFCSDDEDDNKMKENIQKTKTKLNFLSVPPIPMPPNFVNQSFPNNCGGDQSPILCSSQISTFTKPTHSPSKIEERLSLESLPSINNFTQPLSQNELSQRFVDDIPFVSANKVKASSMPLKRKYNSKK